MTAPVQAIVINTVGETQTGITTLPPDLNTLQTLAGGDIQAVHGYRTSEGHDDVAPRMTFFVNEEGKLHRLPPNGLATALWWHYNRDAIGRDFLVGTVIVVGGAGHSAALPVDVIDTYNRLVSGEYYTGFRY